MPQVRKLNPDEVRTIENKGKGTRKIAEEEYDRIIADFAPGDYGEVTLGPEDKRLTVRNRLKAAASRRGGISLTFARTRGDEIRFKVEDGVSQPAAKPKAVRESAVQEPMPVTPSRTTRSRQAEIEREPFEDETPPVVPSLNTQPAKKRPGRPKKNA